MPERLQAEAVGRQSLADITARTTGRHGMPAHIREQLQSFREPKP